MKIQFTQINVDTNLMLLYEERIAPFIWTFINGCFKVSMLSSMMKELHHLFGLSLMGTSNFGCDVSASLCCLLGWTQWKRGTL